MPPLKLLLLYENSERASLDVCKFFFSQRVLNEWNLLPQEVVDAIRL